MRCLLFLDPFQYTMIKPYRIMTALGKMMMRQMTETNGTGPWDSSNSTGSSRPLKNSNAKYKFVFSHHVTRGNIEYECRYWNPGRRNMFAAVLWRLTYFEWGGHNSDGILGF